MTLHAPPFTITACAGFAGEAASPWQGAPVQAIIGELDHALATIRPTLFVDMPEHLCPEGGLSLGFERLADFTPPGLLNSQPYLQDLLAAAAYLREAAAQHLPDSDRQHYFDRRPHLPRTPLAEQAASVHRPPPATPGPGPLDNLLGMVDIPERQPDTPGDPDAGAFYENLALTIAKRIARDRRFRSLEAAWLGLHFLEEHIGAGDAVRLSLIPVNESNLQQSLARQRDNLVDRPPSLLLFDLPFDNSSRSMELLGELARCADTLMTPAVAWITPTFFQCADWQQLDRRPFLPHYLDDPAYAVFRTLRKSPTAAWLCLCCNRLLGRTLVSGFDEVNGSSATALPWIAPVWGVAALIAQRIAASGMPTGMAQQRHNQLTNLARIAPGSEPPAGCETVFPEHRVEQLLSCGIVPLVPLVRQGSAFMADDRMLARGASASFQFMLSLLVHCLLTLQDQRDYHADGEQLAAAISDDLHLLLAERCRSDPGTVAVNTENGPSGKGTPLHVSWRPAGSIVGPKDVIELQILW